jgi:uncharacterized protein YkwD
MTARLTYLALAVLAVLAALLGSPMAGTAHASACNKYGDDRPEELTVKHAQKAVRCLINRKRPGSLDESGKLRQAAQYHSRYMRNHTCFSHRCRGEKDLEGRLRRFDYITSGLRYYSFGENIGWGLRGNGTPREVVSDWMSSSGHKANIVRDEYRDIGVGFMHGSPSNPDAPGGLYTVDFGIRRR